MNETVLKHSTPKALVEYARIHRDERNLLLHLISTPLSWFAVFLLGSAILMPLGIWVLLPFWLVLAGLSLFYIWRFKISGLAAGTLVIALFLLAQVFYQWYGLLTGSVLLMLAYLGHRLGHWYEGREHQVKIAPLHLSIAPVFSAIYLLSRYEPFKSMRKEIDRRAGPLYLRDVVNEGIRF